MNSIFYRSKLWQESMGMKFTEATLRHRRICSRHFTVQSYRDPGSNKLRPDAIPTLFSISQQPPEIPSVRTMSEPVTKTGVGLVDEIEQTAMETGT